VLLSDRVCVRDIWINTLQKGDSDDDDDNDDDNNKFVRERMRRT
jgi:hypothetical protein